MSIEDVLEELSVLEERFADGMGWRDGNYEKALHISIFIIEQIEYINSTLGYKKGIKTDE